MPKVYLSHPYRDNPKENLKSITRICHEVYERHPEVSPISPLHMFSFCTPTDDQEKILEWCLGVLKDCDEIWLCGHWGRSEGCLRELKYAKELGLIVRIYEEDC